MKKIINNIYLMCSIVLLVVLGACSDEDKFMGGNDEIVVTAIMPDDGTTQSHGTLKGVAVSSDDNTLNLITKWKSGDKIQVFVRQDNKVYKVSEESAVYNISSDGKTCSFNFSLPSSIDGARVYDVIGVTGISAQASGSEVYATSTLKRMNLDSNGEATSPMWFITAKTNTATNFQAKFQHLGTYEILHVTNATSGDLTFRHLGFDVSEPWFKYNDNTALNNTYDPTASFTEPGDVESPPILIRAGKTGKILSWYMPSGSLMEGAKLLALINGKNVTSSNTKSSALPIQRGKAYHMYATWDGKQLKFDDNEHGAAEGEIETFTVNGVSFNMIKVEGGTFWMGADDNDTEADDDERPRHQVTLSDFYIGETEVTQALWEAVMGECDFYPKGANLPICSMNLNKLENFIEKLISLTGKNFRLPTEAEWEFAARGGNKSKGYLFSGSNNANDVAWYKDNSGNKIHEVATKYPNELGIYDMSGNAQEWCSDAYSESYYSYSPQSNPVGPGWDYAEVSRGGDWTNELREIRVSNRDIQYHGYGYGTLGIRLVLTNDDESIINTSLCPNENHPHMIDLGLPSGIKWACCNVGTTSPIEFGGYYSWGEIEEKGDIDWNSYTHCDGRWDNVHYLGDISGTQYDVAHVKSGGQWCMPSKDDFNELLDFCSSKWIRLFGKRGRIFTGSNGKSIFFPANEDYFYGSYWSSTQISGYYDSYWGTLVDKAYYLSFSEDSFLIWTRQVLATHSIRPIKK